jgi:hypothetical protein
MDWCLENRVNDRTLLIKTPYLDLTDMDKKKDDVLLAMVIALVESLSV